MAPLDLLRVGPGGVTSELDDLELLFVLPELAGRETIRKSDDGVPDGGSERLCCLCCNTQKQRLESSLTMTSSAEQ